MKKSNIKTKKAISEIEQQASLVEVLKDAYLMLRGNFLSNIFRSRKNNPEKPKFKDFLAAKKTYKYESKKLNKMIKETRNKN